MAETTTTPPKNFGDIYNQLIGDDGVKFTVGFNMTEMIMILGGLFGVITFALVLAARINKRLDG